MEITREYIRQIAAAFPGDFAIYKLANGKFQSLYYSPSLGRLSSFGECEYRKITSDDASAMVFEKDRPCVVKKINDMISSETDDEVELTYRLMNKETDYTWVRVRMRVIGTMDGCPVISAVFINTVLASASYNNILNNSSTGMFIIEKGTYQLLFMNNEAVKFFACGEEPYAGHACYELQKTKFSSPCPYCRISRMKDGYYREEEYVRHDSNHWYNLTLCDTTWFGRDAIAVYNTDITELARRRRGLELSSAALERTVDSIPVGVAVFDVKDGEITLSSVNAKYCELFEFPSPQEMLKKHDSFQSVCPEDKDVFKANVNKLHTPNTHIVTSFRYVPHGGAPLRWYRMEGSSTSADENGEFKIFTAMADITAEVTAENEVRKARLLYEKAIETAGLAVWDYDITARRITMSDSPETMKIRKQFGIPKVIENVPEGVLPIIDEKDRERVLNAYQRIEAGEQSISCEYLYAAKPGVTPRAEKFTYTTVFDKNGRPVHAYSVGQDITSRRIREEEYDLMYRQLAETTTDVIGSFRLNLTKNTCGAGNSRTPRILILQESGTVDGFFAATAARITNLKRREELLKIFSRGNLLAEFASGHTQITAKFQFRDSLGSVYLGEGFINMMLNPYTNDVEAIAYVRDITEREKETEILKIVADRQYDFISIVNPQTRQFELRRDNEKIRDVKIGEKYDVSEYVGIAAEKFVLPEDRKEFLRQMDIDYTVAALNANEFASYTYRCVDGSGKKYFKRVQRTWLDESKYELLCVQSDVTDIYEKEQRRVQQLRSALDKADAANRAKEDFISRISHDIRTPMNAIMNMTSFAFDDINDREKLQDDLKKIQVSNNFLLSLINDVLDISKIDSGKIELHPEPYPYEEHEANVLGILESMCEEKGLKYVIEHPRVNGVIIVDKVRLNQIVLNLLSNAVKYTPQGGTVTYRSLSRILPDDKLAVTLEVSDTGIGMSEEFQKRMFEPFAQETDNPRRPKNSVGTGLGLAIVKHMVELMGGTMRVKSALGHGTTVCCDMVFPRVKTSTENAEVSKNRETPEPKFSGKVLLAEDNEINAEIAVRMLESLGLSVDRAENGSEAADMFNSSAVGEYKAVLMDIQMPIVNGYEATRNIRAMVRPDAAEVPIIAMTADAFADAIERGRKAGMNDYITKPLDLRKIRGILALFIK